MSKKISALNAASALAGTELVPVVQGSETKKATVDQVLTYINGATLKVYGGASAPNASQSASGPALYIQTKLTPTGHAGLWIKPTGSTGNTGWEEIAVAD